MPGAELSSLLAAHSAVRSAFVTDGEGRFTHQVGEHSPDAFATDVEVLFGSVDAFTSRSLGGAKLLVLTCERGVVVARRSGAAGGGVLGALAADVAALGTLIHYLSDAELPRTDGVEP